MLVDLLKILQHMMTRHKAKLADLHGVSFQH